MAKGIFVTATGTDVGKTYISGLILKKLIENGCKATYYKGALSGALEIDGKLVAGDAKEVLETAGIQGDPNSCVSYIYKTPVSPHLASQIEGNPIELSKMLSDYSSLKIKNDYILTEGSGGLICPLRLDEGKLMLTDLIKALGLEILIVASAGLGTINATLLTVSYANQMGIVIRGIILNGYERENPMHIDNKNQIEKLVGMKITTTVAKGDKELDISIEELKSIFS
ncbi:MAG: dethiobiotin synthase [Proteocatella sp.]